MSERKNDRANNNMSVGFGDQHAHLRVYCANRIPLSPFADVDSIMPFNQGDITHIGKHTSNHWRKIFNVYAKLVFDLLPPTPSFDRWQSYRDNRLLQHSSDTALIFAEQKQQLAVNDAVHIVMGKGYATNLLGESFLSQCFWPTADFAVSKTQQIIVSPYFDYRQLNNEKITVLQSLIKSMTKVNLSL